MSVSVSMPQLGESVTEGTVTRWLKREGEHVQADEPLLEVSTDKVDTEIPSPVSGILRGISVAEDETVAVGAELAVIDEDGAAGGAAPVAAAPPAEAAAAEPTSYLEPQQAAAGRPGPDTARASCTCLCRTRASCAGCRELRRASTGRAPWLRRTPASRARCASAGMAAGTGGTRTTASRAGRQLRPAAAELPAGRSLLRLGQWAICRRDRPARRRG